jgi:hypothetical protein
MDKELGRIADALEKILEKLENPLVTTTSTAVAVELPPVVAEPVVAEPVAEKVDLKAYAVQVCQKLGAAKTPAFTNEVRRILSGYGFSKLSDVTADKASAVHKEIEKWVASQK